MEPLDHSSLPMRGQHSSRLVLVQWSWRVRSTSNANRGIAKAGVVAQGAQPLQTGGEEHRQCYLVAQQPRTSCSDLVLQAPASRAEACQQTRVGTKKQVLGALEEVVVQGLASGPRGQANRGFSGAAMRV